MDNNLDELKKKGYEFYCSGQYENALECYREILKDEPLNCVNYCNLGLAYHALNDVKNAYDSYYSALNINPCYLPAINNIGILYFEANEIDRAVEMFKRAIETDSGNPEAYHYLGIINRECFEDFELSELYLKRAISLDTLHLQNYTELAKTYIKFGEKEKAKLALKIALEIDSEQTTAKELLKNLSEDDKPL